MIVMYIDSEWIGRGNDELGSILMKAYLDTLSGETNQPDKMIFVNSGVKLIAQGSDCLDALKKLEEAGVTLLACRTCLDYYNLLEKVAVGEISNAHDILNNLMQADKAISL